jgi:hypothetical protein
MQTDMLAKMAFGIIWHMGPHIATYDRSSEGLV